MKHPTSRAGVSPTLPSNLRQKSLCHLRSLGGGQFESKPFTASYIVQSRSSTVLTSSIQRGTYQGTTRASPIKVNKQWGLLHSLVHFSTLYYVTAEASVQYSRVQFTTVKYRFLYSVIQYSSLHYSGGSCTVHYRKLHCTSVEASAQYSTNTKLHFSGGFCLLLQLHQSNLPLFS